MINYLTLALTHGLIALALWRLLFRPDLDVDGAPATEPRRSWRKAAPPAGSQEGAGDA